MNKTQITGDQWLPQSAQKTFSSYFAHCYVTVVTDFKKTFEILDYVSTTTDIWTSDNKSFLEMTVPCT